MNPDLFWLTDAQFFKIEPCLSTYTRGTRQGPCG